MGISYSHPRVKSQGFIAWGAHPHTLWLKQGGVHCTGRSSSCPRMKSSGSVAWGVYSPTLGLNPRSPCSGSLSSHIRVKSWGSIAWGAHPPTLGLNPGGPFAQGARPPSFRTASREALCMGNLILCPLGPYAVWGLIHERFHPRFPLCSGPSALCMGELSLFPR